MNNNINIKNEKQNPNYDTDFTEYMIVGGNGFVDGIRDDAPPEIKRQFKDYLRKRKSK